jgi:branched-chain amino acid transport system permease protein
MIDKRIAYGIALIAGLIAPHLFYPLFLMNVLCFALFACSFNLLIGFAGLVSFGHAAFFGGAGYVAGYVLASRGWPLELGLLAGVATGALMGLAFGLLAARRQGIYFSMITLALAQMMYFVFLQAPFTGGEDGLQAIPRGKLLGIVDLTSDMSCYYVVFTIAALGFALIFRTIHSPFGQVLKAIKENEPRALSLGYDVTSHKLLAFVISTALAGLAGAIKAVALGAETLTDAHWAMSGLVILMVLIGGMGTYFGPVVGAFVIVALETKLGDFGNLMTAITHVAWFTQIGGAVTMVTGMIFVVCVLLFRKGIVGALVSMWPGNRLPGRRLNG